MNGHGSSDEERQAMFKGWLQEHTRLVFWGFYWLNQRAVRDELLPRRQELQAMIASLDDTNHAGELPTHVGGGA